MKFFIIIVTALLFFSCSDDTPLQPGRAPSPPVSLTSSSLQGAVQLNWFPPNDPGTSPVNQYNIYRGIISGNEAFLQGTDSDSLSFTDTSAVSGTIYFYYVTAVNNSGESGPSNEINESAGD
jgi:fibronectin type 3 domain-containing protein